jgi:hypothetical protein
MSAFTRKALGKRRNAGSCRQRIICFSSERARGQSMSFNVCDVRNNGPDLMGTIACSGQTLIG